MHEGTCLTMIEIHEHNMSTFHEVGINEEDYDSESGEFIGDISHWDDDVTVEADNTTSIEINDIKNSPLATLSTLCSDMYDRAAGNAWFQGLGKRKPRSLSPMISSLRQYYLPPFDNIEVAISQASTNSGDSVWATIDSDNHADTWCLGRNFIMDHYTGQVCDVSDFNHKVRNKEIRIGSGLTVFENPQSGRPQLLQVDQALDFTDILDHSLANPNQSRAFGIDWCDDAWDPNRSFGITIDNGTFIPFTMKGSSAVFKTRTPTSTEIRDLFEDRIILTGNDTWNPLTLKPPNVNVSSGTSTKRLISAVQVMKQDIPPRSLQVCETLERDTGYIKDSGDSRLIASISTALTDETLLPRIVANVHIAETISENRHSDISPESLSAKWRIGLNTARDTLKVTTQQGIRQAVRPITRRYRTDTMSLKMRRIRATVYSDTGFISTKSLRQNTCYQGFSCENFIHIVPMKKQTEAGDALMDFAHDVGAPAEIITDGAPLLIGKESDFAKTARFLRSKLSSCEPGTQKQNLFEGETRLFKRRWKICMSTKNVPKRLWDFGLVHEARILSMIARGSDGIPGLEKLTGDTIDITEYLDFDFYDLVWFHDEPAQNSGPKLGRWLGVSHRVGSALCYHIIKENGSIESRTTVQHVPREDLIKPEIAKQVTDFDLSLRERLNDKNFHLEDGEDVYEDTDIEFNDYENDNHGLQSDLKETVDRDDYNDEAYDQLLSAEILLPNENGDGHIRGTVNKRLKNNMGQPIGQRHNNPMLDTRQYVVKMSDGTERELQHNLIAENMFSQADSEGRQFMLLSDIADVRRLDSALTKENGFITSKNGNKHRKKTTKGWEFLVEWKDNSQDWMSLKEMKSSNPLETAEFVVARGLQDEPAFSWWINDVLSTRKRIIEKVKSRYWKTTHKFGIKIPKTVEEAFRFDEENNNTFWRDSIEKEMKTVSVAYHKYVHDDDGELSAHDVRSNQKKYLVGYKEITCHMIFDIKLDGNFTRKARFVANGSKTEAPKSLTYSSVVSRDSVRIAFLMASLNDLDISACDISGAYLNAPAGEKCWFKAGAESGSDKNAVMIITRALYGLKSSAKAWRDFFKVSLDEMGYKSCPADPDVYMKAECTKEGHEYWSYMLVYVDDCLLVHHDPDPVMEELKSRYTLKKDAYGRPDRYLGANIQKYQLNDGNEYWCMHPGDYVKLSCKLIKEWSDTDNRRWTKSRKNAMITKYRPELDMSPELGDDLASRYQQMIGILRWAVELGRIDIITEVSFLSSHNCSPRAGHLEAAFQVFEYLDSHDNGGRVVFDSSPVDIDESIFKEVNWKEIYGDVEEELPPNMPTPRGNPVTITMFCDAAFAGDIVTRRSHTGILFFINNAPIHWYSKKQATIEASTFGSEFVALRVGVEMNEGIRYKMRMMGIPINGPTNGFCDNDSVVSNASKAESTLKKKHLSICYHLVRECCARGSIRIAFEPTGTNLSDVCTKILPAYEKKNKIKHILY
jgi:hypothetical protein